MVLGLVLGFRLHHGEMVHHSHSQIQVVKAGWCLQGGVEEGVTRLVLWGIHCRVALRGLCSVGGVEGNILQGGAEGDNKAGLQGSVVRVVLRWV